MKQSCEYVIGETFSGVELLSTVPLMKTVNELAIQRVSEGTRGEIPNSKLQAPEKLQIPITKTVGRTCSWVLPGLIGGSSRRCLIERGSPSSWPSDSIRRWVRSYAVQGNSLGCFDISA